MEELIQLKSFPIQATLKILLQDKTTKRNIIWATSSYKKYGVGYDEKDEITIKALKKLNPIDIQPRALKALETQKSRTKKRAEVFTPSWICNQMNNSCDEQWFGRKDVFNIQTDKTWRAKSGKIKFSKDIKSKTWTKYVDSRRIEITCGEAPYLVSRYDTTTGELIKISKRIGILDRKLRVVNENTSTKEDWLKWVIRAYQSTYGYEFQGDNLLIARINLLLTFVDYYVLKWKIKPSTKELIKIARIITWNIWQMDGLTYRTPLKEPIIIDVNFKDTYTKIKNWRNGSTGQIIYFKNIKGGRRMKFYAAIFNPPYQEEKENTSDVPIYPKFLDSAYELADVVETITPGRFLFNAGKTPKEWNLKMLNDRHIKVVYYEQDGHKIFPTTQIKGGVAIVLRNKNIVFGAIKVFIPYQEMKNIYFKIKEDLLNGNLSDIMILQNRYASVIFVEHPDLAKKLSTDGTERRLVSSCFDKNPYFTNNKIANDDIKILGIQQLVRTYKYLSNKYIEDNGNLNKYKVLIPNSNGSGAVGEVLSTPLIGTPLIGYTQSFIGIGCFNTKQEAESVMKYIKTKFCRCTLGILKVTQSNSPDKWRYVPLQNFTEESDIDWSKSITEIDQQLYKKYNLTQEEINFIETKISSMDNENVEAEKEVF